MPDPGGTIRQRLLPSAAGRGDCYHLVTRLPAGDITFVRSWQPHDLDAPGRAVGLLLHGNFDESGGRFHLFSAAKLLYAFEQTGQSGQGTRYDFRTWTGGGEVESRFAEIGYFRSGEPDRFRCHYHVLRGRVVKHGNVRPRLSQSPREPYRPRPRGLPSSVPEIVIAR